PDVQRGEGGGAPQPGARAPAVEEAVHLPLQVLQVAPQTRAGHTPAVSHCARSFHHGRRHSPTAAPSPAAGCRSGSARRLALASSDAETVSKGRAKYRCQPQWSPEVQQGEELVAKLSGRGWPANGDGIVKLAATSGRA